MKPHKIFSDNIEAAALSQFYDAMKLDCVVRGALMPDAHAGYTLPIGAVVATDGVVFPSFVGYDIGCGVAAIKTTFDRKDIEANAKAIFDQIYRDVPVGFNHNELPVQWEYDGYNTYVVDDILKKGGLRQLGTLGGGNHFIEVGYDEQDAVWITVHSGSRNVGHTIAKHYMKVASPNGKASEGFHGLLVDSQEGHDYIADLAFGLAFALQNRQLILGRAAASVATILNCDSFSCVNWEGMINRNHNHAEKALVDGASEFGPKREVWIHRKGATHAEDGMMGVIPGNMRDGSFIVRGKGNADSMCSSSHGAGRVMGRKVAKETLSVATFHEQMYPEEYR